MTLAVNHFINQQPTTGNVKALPVIVFVVLIFLFLTGCKKPATVWQLSGDTMGTTYHVTVVNPPDTAQQSSLKSQIDQALLHINQLMSTYIPDSELSRFNQTPVHERFTLSPETFAVIQYGLALSEKTQGQFDVTVDPLIRLWGFDNEALVAFPTDAQIDRAKTYIGWQFIELNSQDLSVKKTKPLSVNLSAIAKGYGVDHIVSLLEQQGITNYLVEIGGEIRVRGKNSKGSIWRLGIETPSLLPSGAQQIIAVDNKAVATSGNYRNFFEHQGKRYSHTINPKTGKPVIHNIASLTVVADTAMEADGLATALMVFGEERAIDFANRYNIPLYMLLYQDGVFTPSFSISFQPYLQ